MAATPLANATLTQITDGTNVMPTGDTSARPLWVSSIVTANVNGASDGISGGNIGGIVGTSNSGYGVAVGCFAFNGSNWDRLRANMPSTPLATVAAAKVTQTTPDLLNPNGTGLLIHVKFANLAGAATFTPRLQWKDNSGNYWTIWTAAAAIAANSDKTYQLFPSAADAGAHTESKQIVCPRNFRLQLVYAGNGTTDAADVTIDMEIIV